MSRRTAFPWVGYAFLVTMAGTTLPTPLYPIYQSRFGFGELTITVIFATYAFGVIAGLVLTGRLSDEIGRRPVLLFGLVCAAISAVLFLLAHGLAPMLVARAVSGLSAGAFTGTATAYLLDLAPEGRRAMAAAVAVAVNLGGLGCGTLLSGALAEVGWVPLRLSYWVHLALLLPAVAGLLLAPETVSRSERPRFAPQRLGVPSEVRGTFVRAAMGGFASFAVGGLFGAVGPSFMAQFLGYRSHVLAGMLVFALFLASAVTQPAVRLLPERTALVGGSCGLVAATLLAIGAFEAESLALLFASSVVAGAGQGLAVGGGVAAVSAEAPVERRGEVAASFFVVLYVGLSVPIIAAGLLSQATGLRTAGVSLEIAMGALAAAGAVSLLRRRVSTASSSPAGRS